MQSIHKWQPSQYIVDKDNQLSINEMFLKNYCHSKFSLTIHAKEFNRILKYISGKLLDLGCGNVPFYDFYKNSITENVCVDWKNSVHKNPYVDFELDIMQPLPFSSSSFDTILCTQVLEHIYNPFLVFKELHRVLKTNGYLIISSNFAYCEHEVPHDYLRHSQYFFKRIAKENDFAIQEIIPIGDGLVTMVDIAEKIYKKKDNNKWEFKILYCFLTYLFKKYSLKNKKFLENEPLSYCCVLKKI